MSNKDSLLLWAGILIAAVLLYLLAGIIALTIRRNRIAAREKKKEKKAFQKAQEDVTAELPEINKVLEAMGFSVEEDITFGGNGRKT